VTDDSGAVSIAALHYERADDAATNRERLLGGLERALVDEDADVAVGPETATTNTGRPTAEIREQAEPVDGPTVRRARNVVEAAGGVAVFGLAERDGRERYNAAVVLERGREPRVRRQVGAEGAPGHGWVTDHGDVRTFETGVGTLAPVVCAELLFERPDVQATIRAGGADLVAVPSTWRDPPPAVLREHGVEPGEVVPIREKWTAAAGRLGCPVAVGNVYRPAELSVTDDYDLDGPAAVLTPDGAVAERSTPGVACATVTRCG
jgi:predicted amidohydrolase